jgi:regulatory protein
MVAGDGSSKTGAVASGPPPAQDGELERALGLALRQLGRRDRTAAELRRQLERRGVAPETVEAALVRLGELGYVDDARFARRFAEDRRRLDGWGRERIARRLLAAGVAEELVEAALDGVGAGELEAALALLRRRFPLAPADPATHRRAFGLLVRKGYDAELAGDALRAYAREG